MIRDTQHHITDSETWHDMTAFLLPFISPFRHEIPKKKSSYFCNSSMPRPCNAAQVVQYVAHSFTVYFPEIVQNCVIFKLKAADHHLIPRRC